MDADKAVVITGANSGLGFVAARTIAQSGKGWHVVLACRDAAKGRAAQQRLSEITGSSAISVMELDLASLRSARDFAEKFKEAHLPPLHGLINNAGTQTLCSEVQLTKDGFETTFQTNQGRDRGVFFFGRLLFRSDSLRGIPSVHRAPWDCICDRLDREH